MVSDRTFRPHYHAIVFGLPLNDLKRHGGSPSMPTFTSEFLNSVWKNGNVLVAECNHDTCSYVARYVTKKSTGKLGEFYDYYNISPEFVTMSRKPGIARNFYDESLFEDDYFTVGTCKGSIICKPPKYFKRILEADNSVKANALSERNRQKAEYYKAAKMTDLSYSYMEMLEIEERNKKKQISTLKRSVI